VVTNIKDNRLEIKIGENITVSWVQDKLDQMRELIDKNNSYDQIVLDMKGVDTIDSVGVNLIIALNKTANQISKGFKVTGLNGKVMNLFRVLRLDQVLTVES